MPTEAPPKATGRDSAKDKEKPPRTTTSAQPAAGSAGDGHAHRVDVETTGAEPQKTSRRQKRKDAKAKGKAQGADPIKVNTDEVVSRPPEAQQPAKVKISERDGPVMPSHRDCSSGSKVDWVEKLGDGRQLRANIAPHKDKADLMK